MQNHINHFLIVALVSVVAAFFPYLASQFFDSSQNHGILSADVFFLLLLFSLPEGKILYKLPVAVAAGVYAIASNEIDAYAITGVIILAVFAAACMPRKRKYMLPVYAAFSLFFLIADAGNFFYSTFVLTKQKHIFNKANIVDFTGQLCRPFLYSAERTFFMKLSCKREFRRISIAKTVMSERKAFLISDSFITVSFILLSYLSSQIPN